MTNKDIIEEAIVGHSAFTNSNADKLLNELDKVYQKAKVFEEIQSHVHKELEAYDNPMTLDLYDSGICLGYENIEAIIKDNKQNDIFN